MRMFLLQAQAPYYIGVDAATTPLANMIVIAVFLLIVFLAGAYIMVKHVKKVGPLDLTKDRQGRAYEYAMNKANEEHESRLRLKIQLVINSLDDRFENIFRDLKLCAVARIALSNLLGNLLHISAQNNHFTSALQQERRPRYIKNMLRAMEDKYTKVRGAICGTVCERAVEMPPWDSGDPASLDDIKPRIAIFLEELADKIAQEVRVTCQKKIETYERYLLKFREAGDAYHAAMVEGLITRNKNYKAALAAKH